MWTSFVLLYLFKQVKQTYLFHGHVKGKKETEKEPNRVIEDCDIY